MIRPSLTKVKMLALSVLLVCGLVAGTEPVLAQNAVSNLNSTYGNWIALSGSTVAATSGQTVQLNNCYVNVGAIGGGHPFFPFATNVPVQINDGSNSEVVTPSSVQTPIPNTEPAGPNPYICSFTATFTNAHSFGPTTFITSGDSGRAEAANDNGNGYPLTQGISWLAGSCTGTATASSTIYLYGLGGAGSAQTCTLTAVSGNPPVMFRPGVMKGLQATATAGGVGSGSGVLTVKKNGSATALTCTFGTGTTCSDTTHSVSFVVGDVITASFTTASGETLAGVVATVEAF